ncbi:MAG: hypothetical protein KGL59_01610, partial [Acidobacteriota bacterium]|nr:hypothetical protein [Acidobacteriota bacterium]
TITITNGTCPGTITTNVVLGSGIIADSSLGSTPCITVGADGLTIDLSTYTLDLSGAGSAAVAIENSTHNNTTITGSGGTIITDYPSPSTTSAIDIQGGTGISINNVTLQNDPVSGAACAQFNRTTTNGGTGISINSVTGASLSGNSVYCYQYGIFVLNSTIPSKGTGSISGNYLEADSYDMLNGTSGVYSGGLVLNNSSGWTVSGNTIEFDGGYDKNSTCLYDATTGVMSCAFGLQVINSSSANNVSNNTVNSNFGGGIYADSTTSNNKFVGDTALNNAIFDIFDAGSRNGWHKDTCLTSGGNLGSHTCH